MKKTLFFGIVMAGMLSLGSCSSEADMPDNATEESSTISLALPAGVNTRAFAKGEKANQISYAVYVHNEGQQPGTPLSSEVGKKVTFDSEGICNLSIKLVNGKEYDIVFWADNDATSRYTFDPDTHSIKMNDEAFTTNMDESDAFYGVLTTPVIDGDYSGRVELTRPFAQLNLGASDLYDKMLKDVHGVQDGKVYTTLTVDTYTQFDIFTGKSLGKKEPKTYALPSDIINTEDNVFPFEGKTYKYVSMHYLLMPQSDNGQENDVANLNYNFYASPDEATPFHSIEVPNVPVRQNYRTNLYGQIFTVNGQIEVDIEPGISDINFPINLQATTVEELKAAFRAAKSGTVITIPTNASISLNANVVDGEWEGDFIEPEVDMTLQVNGALTFGGMSQIVPMEGATLTLTGNGKVASSSDVFLLRAESGDINVTGSLKFNLSGAGGLGVASNNHKLTFDNVKVNANITNTLNGSVLGMADGGSIEMTNSTVTSNIRIGSYVSDLDYTGDMYMKAETCKFITNASTFNSPAFSTYGGKTMKYEMIDTYIASNTGCAYVAEGGTFIFKGTSMSKAGRISNFKNSDNYYKTPVLVANGAKGIQISGYAGIYNEWNDDNATIASVKVSGEAACYMMQSYYTGPTSDASGNVIEGYSGYTWSEIPTTGSFNYGKVLGLDGNMVDKTSSFKFRYSK